MESWFSKRATLLATCSFVPNVQAMIGGMWGVWKDVCALGILYIITCQGTKRQRENREMIKEYSLDLNIDFDVAFISGNVRIHVIDLEQDRIELDAKELDVKAVNIDDNALPFEYDKVKNLLTISGLPRTKQEFLINVRYDKQISDSATTGVYKCRNGSDYFIITDFEPDRASALFPCKDHPLWKAVFNVSVTTGRDLKVISNTLLKSVKTIDEKHARFVFNPTPNMSTYLLFIGIGRFVELESRDEGTKVIVASRREVSNDCDFTLKIAKRALKESEDYFDVPYPLEKLHIIGLTEYSGAMENWGAITASEIVSIIGEKTSTLFDKQRAALVTIHEIEHQWFGDLVTMKWWNDIWLNESFATYMSHKILDRIHPDWEIWSFFVVRYLFEAKKIDALMATHSVEMQISTPSEMNEAFDHISYDKGASILRMIEEFVGNEMFQRGITNYLRSFSYSNASSEDLWNSLEQTSAQPVSEIMRAWLRDPGFPLVSVSVSGGKLVFTQERFLLSSKLVVPTEPSRVNKWPIPIIMELNGRTSKFLFSDQRREIELPDGKLSSLVLNLGQSGFYCVQYDRTIYDLLENSFHSLSSLDKAGLLNDLSQLCLSGRIDPELFYRFVQLCYREDEYTVVYTILRELELLAGIAEGSSKLNELSLGFLKAQMHRIGIEMKGGEKPNDRVLREIVSYELAKNDIEFAKEMAKLFERYDSLEPELKSAVAVGYARNNGSRAFETILDRVKGSSSEIEREKLYSGLCALDDPRVIERLLEFGSSGAVPRPDIFWVVYYSSRTNVVRRTVWIWIKRNFDKLWELLGSPLFVLNLLDYVIARSAIEDEDDAREFLLSKDIIKKGEKSFRRQLELLHVYASFRKRAQN